jgi:hypothetical protein
VANVRGGRTVGRKVARYRITIGLVEQTHIPWPLVRQLLVVVVFTAPVCGAADDSWQNLKRIRRDKEYTLLNRLGGCITGQIAGVEDGLVKLVAKDALVKVVTRPDVLRVTDNQFGDPHDSIFSGRSSWADVRESRPKVKAEWLKVTTKEGKERTCKASEVLEDRLKCGTDVIPKRDIERVYYVRLKPASEWLEYAAKEGVAWLDARSWFNYLLLGRIDVLLFDSATSEESEPVACKIGNDQ